MIGKNPVMSKVGVIFLTWRRYLQRDLNPQGITLKQLYVLRQLKRKEFLYPSQIAEILFCDRPTATVVIKNMERDKWVRREKDLENAKQTRIFITPEGIKKLDLADEQAEKGQLFDPLGCFTEEEKLQFEQLINKLGKHIKQIEK